MNSFLYLRGLKSASHTVFGVSQGQKYYYDPQFSTRMPYSSGQQVKRSVLEVFLAELGLSPAPVTFVSNLDKNGKLGEGEPWSACDPRHPDQLVGGWMRAQKGGDNRTLKRRSPLSISAMRPLHPLLAGMSSENITFDRSDRPTLHKVIVRDADNKELSEEELAALLKGTDRSVLRKWIPENTRASGLFVYDVAVDMRTLFCVSTNDTEPEVTPAIREALQATGWQPGVNSFGPCLVCPPEQREKLIPALAKALLDWRILTNQSRTFDLMKTLAVAVSDNANAIGAAIRAKLVPESEGSERPKARPVLEQVNGVDLFITPSAAEYVFTEEERADALSDAEQEIARRLRAFSYEQQV
ncbi:CRISPR-associated protein Cas7 [Hymenobacter sublimis]|uniref:CRISPR-associated protein Cas7 n=1 Tax=Hymenobacter sublimis TaxID=2933777 RepID=A0ABY4J8C0_9BACT|nr:CRISPR-associated protein Cas7 [Hymenobacter sublimis]UPL47654.1 CRISPR-associated protein Cas7 [Hymenobacter sublimis]